MPTPLELYSGHPEAELLCCCARTAWGPDIQARVRELIREGVDWKRVLYLARQHRLRPLLSHALAEMEVDGVPDDVLARLRRDRQGLTLQSLLWTRELVRILELFRAHGIQALTFKGPVLGHEVYRDLGLRPFGDLDLLLRREDIARAKALLQLEGYRPSLDMDDAEEQAYLDEQYAYGLVHDRLGAIVELHWTLSHRGYAYRADLDAVWAHSRTVSLAGMEIRTLGVEDLAVFLCMHGAKHLWHQLILVADIAELFRAHPDLDTQLMLGLARKARCERIVGLGLYLAHRLFDAPVPAPLRAALSDGAAIQSLVDQVAERAFTQPGREVKLVEEVSFHVRTRESWRDRLRALRGGAMLAIAPSDRDHEYVKLPYRWRFLYYAVRPFRIARTEWKG